MNTTPTKGTDTLHEEAGAAVLDRFFPASVTDCIRWHVAAKRYLCATDRKYLSGLSAASAHTLTLQGWPTDTHEVKAFAKHPNLEAILQVRVRDDQGKVKNMPTPPYEHYVPLLQRLVDAHVQETK